MKMNILFQRILLPTVWAVLCVTSASAATRYVAQAGQVPSSGFTSWATAASTIQDAVDAAVTGDIILVSNGVYDAGGVFADGQTNRVYINNKKLTLQAVSANPADTIIAGGGTLGADAVRCILIEGAGADYSIVSGFTLTNGYARSNGGGLRSERRLTLTNCWVVACAAATNGGGVSVFYTPNTITHCIIQDNGGNIDANPRFVDAAGGDYRLRGSSPCVNAGMNLDGMTAAVDLDGQPRIFPIIGGTVDIGAYERIPSQTETLLLIK